MVVKTFTVKLGLKELPNNADIFVRGHFRSLATGRMSEQLKCRFRTPAKVATRPLRFAWSGDLAGQGFGINPDIGGYRLSKLSQMLSLISFINCGDVIYADTPLRESKKVAGGRTWRNLVTDAQREVAQSFGRFSRAIQIQLP